MSKFISILILLALVIGSIFVVKYSKDAYELLPVNESGPMKAWDSDVEHNFHEWHEFTSPSGEFKVLLPALPQHATDKIIDSASSQALKYDMYAASDEQGRAYMISAITFPAPLKASEEEAALTKAVNDMLARGKDNKLKMMKMSNLRGFRAVDFSLENSQVAVAGKAIVHGNIIYVLSMIDKTGQFHDKILSFFVNSFDIEGNPAVKKRISPGDHDTEQGAFEVKSVNKTSDAKPETKSEPSPKVQAKQPD